MDAATMQHVTAMWLVFLENALQSRGPERRLLRSIAQVPWTKPTPPQALADAARTELLHTALATHGLVVPVSALDMARWRSQPE